MNPIDALFSVGEKLIDRIWPDPAQRAEQLYKLEQLKQSGDLAELQAHVQLLTGQMEINKIEASHKSLFVAGWRPFIGWCCGVSLAYVGILEPLLRFIAKMYGYEGEFPIIDTTLTMQVLLGMLGLGVMRTREKEKGVHKDALK